jgi:hypothetical protein
MKKLFEKLSSFVKSLLGNIFDEFKKHSEAAVKVTGNIKKLVESPIADVVVTVIPGDIDNAIVEKLRKVLPEVTQKVAILHGILKENDTNSDIIANVIENLKQMNPDARVSFWVLFSGELNKALSDGKLDLAEAFVLSQMAYIELKRTK